MVLRGPAAGGSTGRVEEKIPSAFRFRPGMRLVCCWGEEIRDLDHEDLNKKWFKTTAS